MTTTTTTTMMQSVVALNNEACSRLWNGSCSDDSIRLLSSALSLMKNGIVQVRNNGGVWNQQQQTTTTGVIHHHNDSHRIECKGGRSNDPLTSSEESQTSWATASAHVDALLRNSTATLTAPCHPPPQFHRADVNHSQSPSPSLLPASSSSVRTIGIRPLVILPHHEDASLLTLSMMVLFNLALASHLRGMHLLSEQHHVRCSSHPSITRQDASHLLLLMYQDGTALLRKANRLYQLTLQVLGDRHEGPVRDLTMYAIILNNLSHTHQILGQPMEAYRCDETLLMVLLARESDNMASAREGREENVPPTTADDFGILSDGEVQPVLDALLENVWYVYGTRSCGVGAAAA